MIDADERRRLSHAVALNDCKAQPLPKAFGVRIEGGAAGNEGPELPAEHSMNTPKCPPPEDEVAAFGGYDFFSKLLKFATRFVVSFNSFAQDFEHPRHRHHNRDTFAPDGFNDVRRIERCLKEDFAAKQLGHEDTHELSEHVAQRYQIEKAQRMDQALPFQ